MLADGNVPRFGVYETQLRLRSRLCRGSARFGAPCPPQATAPRYRVASVLLIPVPLRAVQTPRASPRPCFPRARPHPGRPGCSALATPSICWVASRLHADRRPCTLSLWCGPLHPTLCSGVPHGWATRAEPAPLCRGQSSPREPEVWALTRRARQQSGGDSGGPCGFAGRPGSPRHLTVLTAIPL